jgi:selenocysteine-specific elongation factor
MKQLTIGVAGHVDHGKTSFVRQITGIDTDRHPEEKRRGLSLEAGIACWPRPDGTVTAFVDVPGHRDFLKNTVRGLQGVDFAVLLVAADDGVMPQTKEHLDILTFFRVNDGIVVLSKIDCVDREILELAELESMELTRGTFLEGKPVIRFSARTGAGRDEAIEAIDRALASGSNKKTTNGFRLWIDQVRGFPGVGTVVSGTVQSGTVKVNEEVELLPARVMTRIRSLEEHGRKIESAAAGQRLGLNLHRLQSAEPRRGMCLVQPGRHPMANRFNCELRLRHHAGEIIKDRQKVKLYLGTSVHNVLVRIIDSVLSDQIGEYGLVQLQTKKPVPIAAGDPFVVSPLNRNTIIGGGRVQELAREKVRAANKAMTALRLKAILDNDLDGYVEQICQLHPGQPIDPEELSLRTLWDAETVHGYIASAVAVNDLVSLTDGRVVRSRELTSFTEIFMDIVADVFKRQPARESMLVQEIIHQCSPPCHEALAYHIMENLCQEGKWVKEKGGIRPAGFEQRFPDDLALVAEVVRSFADNQQLRPFSAEYFVKSIPHDFTLGQVCKVLDYLCKNKEMIRLRNDRYLTAGALEGIKEKIRAWVERKGEIHLRDCKDALDFNRGLGAHVLEYLDRAGFTIKKGEGRVVVGNEFPYAS